MVSLSGERTGTFYAFIYRRGAALTSNYRLQLAVPLEGPDDRFEDNDTVEIVNSREEGAPDSPNLGTLTTITPLLDQVMDDTGDWFRFQTAAVSTYEHYVRISLEPLDGDVDLCVYRSDLSQVGCSAWPGTDGEQVSLSGERTGTYYARVYPRDVRKGIARYHMQIAPPAADLDDRFEENDSVEVVSSREEGGPDSPNLGVLTAVTPLLDQVMDDTGDWFKFRTAGVGTHDHYVRISLEPLNGDLDLCVYRSDLTQVACSAWPGTDGEQVSLSGERSGTYYARVYPRDRRKGIARYHMEVAPPAEAGDDLYEENDTAQEVDAREEGVPFSPNLGLLTAPTQFLGLVMDDNGDWYKFRMAGPATDQHYVHIAFDPLDGDLDLCVYRSNLSLFACSAWPGTDTEQVLFTGLTAGAYYVRVYSRDGREGIASYHMQIVPPQEEPQPGLTPDGLWVSVDADGVAPVAPAGRGSPVAGLAAMAATIPPLELSARREPAAATLQRPQPAPRDSDGSIRAVLTSPFHRRVLDVLFASGSW
jgi:hypothetical protein